MKRSLFLVAILGAFAVWAAETAIDPANRRINGNLTVVGTTTFTGATTMSGAQTVPTLTVTADAGVGGNLTIVGTTTAAAVNSTAVGTPALLAVGVDAGAVRVAGAYVPVAQSIDGGTTVIPRIQYGMATLSSNAIAITFNPAFSSVPQCTCSAINATAAACGVSATASVSAVTFKGANASDLINWICIGDK